MSFRATIIAGLAGLLPFPASACLPIPMHRVTAAADVIVVGRYIDHPEDEERGIIAVFGVERGDPVKTVDVVWSLDVFDDPSLRDCAVEIPASGHFGHFFLEKKEGGTFIMTGRAWEQDPVEVNQEELDE